MAQAQFKQTDLVSDIPGLAKVTDPTLQNPWGVSNLPGSPFWSQIRARALFDNRERRSRADQFLSPE
jgi:hypothetical protein